MSVDCGGRYHDAQDVRHQIKIDDLGWPYTESWPAPEVLALYQQLHDDGLIGDEEAQAMKGPSKRYLCRGTSATDPCPVTFIPPCPAYCR